MPDPFTHTVELILGEKVFTGQVEFNTDGLTSYQFENEPIKTLREAYLINKIFEIMQELQALNGNDIELEIKKIE